MLGLILAIIFALVGTNLFAHSLESVSHTRANEDPDNPKRYLELGWSGRGILAVIPIVIILLLAFISKFGVAASIISLVLTVLMFLAHLFFRVKGFKTFLTWFLIIWANNIACFARSSTNTSDKWTIIWAIITAVLVVIMFIIHLIWNIVRSDEFEIDWSKIKPVIIAIVVLIVAVLVGYFLEAKFDFFPPYRS